MYKRQLKEWPKLSVRFKIKHREKIFSKASLDKPLSCYKDLSKSAFPPEYFVPENIQPPQDLIDLVFGNLIKKDESIDKAIPLICENIHKHFKFKESPLYSYELSHAYDKKEFNAISYGELIKGFLSTLNIPIRSQKGFVLELASSTKVEFATLRNWEEFFVPEVGWVPIDLQASVFNPKMKKSYFAHVSKDSIRLPIENPRRYEKTFSFRGLYGRELDTDADDYFGYVVDSTPIIRASIKKVKN